jgi:hypothetical protein
MIVRQIIITRDVIMHTVAVILLGTKLACGIVIVSQPRVSDLDIWPKCDLRRLQLRIDGSVPVLLFAFCCGVSAVGSVSHSHTLAWIPCADEDI